MFENIDTLIVGAGPSGIVAARKLAESGKRVLILEKKNHIGGQCYDELSQDCIFVHKFGPHIFHTDYEDVWDFLSPFTEWHDYRHQVLGSIDGKLVPIPFNFNTMEMLLSENTIDTLTRKLLGTFNSGERIPILELRNSSDRDIQLLAELIYEKVFVNYSAKQWGKNPEDLDPSVSARVPVVLSRDNRYFHDKYQGIPSEGYTLLFKRMIDHENIGLLLNTDSKDICHIKANRIKIGSRDFRGDVIFTGMIDELFDFSEGILPYRSAEMVFEDHDLNYYQSNSVVNYPNDFDYTRISEFKYFQEKSTDKKTVICKEYPQEYVRGSNDPFYIVENKESRSLYEKYKYRAYKIKGLYMVGRLANYKYYDMDDAIKSALEITDLILDRS